MKLLNTLIPAAAFLALAGSPALADVITADSITCAPDRMARCKSESECTWKTATEKDKEQLLVIDFKEKSASFMNQGKKRGGGIVMDEKAEGDKRSFIVTKDETRNPNTTMELTLTKDGKLTGSRSAGRIKIEATCKAS